MPPRKGQRPGTDRSQGDPPDRELPTGEVSRKKGTVRELLAFRAQRQKNGPGEPGDLVSLQQGSKGILQKIDQRESGCEAEEHEKVVMGNREDLEQKEEQQTRVKTGGWNSDEKPKIESEVYRVSHSNSILPTSVEKKAQRNTTKPGKKRNPSPTSPKSPERFVAQGGAARQGTSNKVKRIRLESYSFNREAERRLQTSQEAHITRNAVVKAPADGKNAAAYNSGVRKGENSVKDTRVTDQSGQIPRNKLATAAQSYALSDRAKAAGVGKARKREGVTNLFNSDAKRKSESFRREARQKTKEHLYDFLLTKILPLTKDYKVMLQQCHTEETWTEELSGRLERALDNDGKTDLNTYLKKSRSLTFNLNKNSQLLELFFSGTVTPERLATLSTEQLATRDVQVERQQLREQAAAACTIIKDPQQPRIRKNHKGDEEVEDINQRYSLESVDDSLFSKGSAPPLVPKGQEITPQNLFSLSKVHDQIPPAHQPILSGELRTRGPILGDSNGGQGGVKISNYTPWTAHLPDIDISISMSSPVNRSAPNQQGYLGSSQRQPSKRATYGYSDEAVERSGWGGRRIRSEREDTDYQGCGETYQHEGQDSSPYPPPEDIPESQSLGSPPYSPPGVTEDHDTSKRAGDFATPRRPRRYSSATHTFIDLTDDDDVEGNEDNSLGSSHKYYPYSNVPQRDVHHPARSNRESPRHNTGKGSSEPHNQISGWGGDLGGLSHYPWDARLVDNHTLTGSNGRQPYLNSRNHIPGNFLNAPDLDSRFDNYHLQPRPRSNNVIGYDQEYVQPSMANGWQVDKHAKGGEDYGNCTERSGSMNTLKPRGREPAPSQTPYGQSGDTSSRYQHSTGCVGAVGNYEIGSNAPVPYPTMGSYIRMRDDENDTLHPYATKGQSSRRPMAKGAPDYKPLEHAKYGTHQHPGSSRAPDIQLNSAGGRHGLPNIPGNDHDRAGPKNVPITSRRHPSLIYPPPSRFHNPEYDPRYR